MKAMRAQEQRAGPAMEVARVEAPWRRPARVFSSGLFVCGLLAVLWFLGAQVLGVIERVDKERAKNDMYVQDVCWNETLLAKYTDVQVLCELRESFRTVPRITHLSDALLDSLVDGIFRMLMLHKLHPILVSAAIAFVVFTLVTQAGREAPRLLFGFVGSHFSPPTRAARMAHAHPARLRKLRGSDDDD